MELPEEIINELRAAAGFEVSAAAVKLRTAEGVEDEGRRPFVRLRPKIFPDGNQWCVLYGENLQEGVAGFGKSPFEAAADFDRQWVTKLSERQP